MKNKIFTVFLILIAIISIYFLRTHYSEYNIKKIKGRGFKYYKKELPNDGEINWKWSGKKIKNFIRAFSFEPFYPPYFYIGKKKMVIVNEKLLKKKFFLKTPK